VPRVFGRRAPEPGQPTPPRAPVTVLRADGQRIDLRSRNTVANLTATRQGWQAEAMAYRNMIGELRFANTLLARNVAEVRFYVAESRAYPDDPAPLDGTDHDLDKQLAADAVANFKAIPLDSEPDGFTARLTENLATPGECYVHIDADDVWHVRSISEVTTAHGHIVVATLPGNLTAARPVDPETEDLLRLWRPDPEWSGLADSPMRAALDTCEDAVLAGREQRAAARSRVAANGILLVPSSLTMETTREDTDAGDGVEEDSFMAELTAAMLAPIRDDGDAQAVVPIVLRGDPEDLDKVRHLTVQRADSESLIVRQNTAILRLLKGLDIQPEQVEGVGATSHWNAWVIDSRAIRDQVKPMAKTVAACLTQAYLRPALESLGHDAAQVARVMIAVDVSPLAENPNRGQDARDAHDAMVISDAALREALGFVDDDAPEDAELLRRMAQNGRFGVTETSELFGLRAESSLDRAPRVVDGAPAQRELPAADRPVAQEGHVTPERPVPATRPEPGDRQAPPRQVVAAATVDDGWVVDVDAARALADLDAALLDRIAIAADAALARVIERAGARVRSQAQRDRALVAALADVDTVLVPSTLGRARVEAFVPVADLLADGYARLRTQVLGWLTAAAGQAADAVVRMLRLRRGSPRAKAVHAAVTSRLAARREQAWSELAAVLDEAAERALFAPDPLTPARERGEPVSTLVRPAEVRRALDVAGGGAPAGPGRGGGVGGGSIVRGVIGDEGGVVLGYEWRYRPEIERDTFEPHRALDGLRFATFTDPKLDTDASTAWLGPFFAPGDHAGCRCQAVAVVAAVDDPEGVVARRLREAQGDPRNVLAARVAAQDSAAGRVGTSLQNEVEVRDRILAGVERLRGEYIEQEGRSA
jgi:hypothetical protein